ncbi:carbohydrate-binding protein [Runella aurantiaca]|uniref:CBM6 domain-containing protein n=1 Tax=Runella aurantiaca TaxID=2282308 RepID=A0A369IE56_9BACT|nr:carbohydrate-binding protein [Runella aurantiaca]RDB05783.1 hypothetical protein DVG78_12415 [Runella aurantiaca]
MKTIRVKSIFTLLPVLTVLNASGQPPTAAKKSPAKHFNPSVVSETYPFNAQTGGFTPIFNRPNLGKWARNGIDQNPIKSSIPDIYKGHPFVDSTHRAGPQVIPGKLECAFYDMGGEGVAYHDFETENRGSDGLNLATSHQRPHATPYEWAFRKKEAVDVSYTKDFADFNHLNNYYTPKVNQLYVGWTEDNEWLNYTVNVKVAGKYKIDALYANHDSNISFDINQKPATACKLPLNTGNFHHWNKGEIGTIFFSEPGLHLLTFHYNKGNNFAYFEFTLVDKKTQDPK